MEPGDTLVLSADRCLSKDQRDSLRSLLAQQFPGNKCLVVDGGMKLGVIAKSDRMERIEQKLDILISALAEEELVDASTISLDGQVLGRDRDESQPL